MHILFLEILMKAYYWLGYKKLSLVNKISSHIAFFAINVRVIYLASIDNKVIIDYFLKN